MSAVGYQYVVLRCVPRVDREEFVNVGVVLYCQARDVLVAATHVDADRLRALAPALDQAAVVDSLTAVSDVCRGAAAAGLAGAAPIGTRFGYLAAPRSTVVQPGPIHGGVTADPERERDWLLARYVEGSDGVPPHASP